MGRVAPPIIASSEPKAAGDPKSTTKPVFFCVLFHTIFVPVLTQNVLFAFALAILGVAEAPSSLRFTSTIQGLEADPHVLPALHTDCGLGSEQAYLSFCASAATQLKSSRRQVRDPVRTENVCRVFI